MESLTPRPQTLADVAMHYCPGCTHGIIHRLAAEVIDELGIRERTIGVCPVGCAVFAYDYFDCDMIQAAHGRAPAVATGVKRALPDRMVFTYQGDGDLASIGAAEIVHAAARGEQISVIFVNNSVYGMTSGQMAPTTLLGQRTTTTPFGRDPALAGYPIRIAEMLATLDGPAYISRVAVTGPRYVNQAKRAIRQAFESQLAKEGFSMVEVISTCPTQWGLSPADACRWAEENMLPQFPLGEFVTRPGNGRGSDSASRPADSQAGEPQAGRAAGGSD